MEIDLDKRRISLDSKLSLLDQLVLDFVSKLDECGIKYCIVSGYVAIVLGRTRGTEDVDIVIERVGREKIACLWKSLSGHFEGLNAFSEEEAWSFFNDNLAVRFFEKGGNWLPNFEIKFVKEPFDREAISSAVTLSLGGREIMISPLEQQVAFKLHLGSEKDLEDAAHLYMTLGEHLDKKLLLRIALTLKVDKETIKILDSGLLE